MRYTNETRTWVPHRTPGASVEIVTRPPTVWRDQPYVTYQVTEADTFLSIAHTRYRSASAYWIIADMNPRIVCPDDVQSGHLIHIPIVS